MGRKKRADCTPEELAARRASGRRYYAKNRDRQLAHQRRYNAKTGVTEKRRTRERLRRAEPETQAKTREYSRRYRRRNREKITARFREQRTGFTPAVFEATIAVQGHCCASCGRPFGGHLRPHADHCHSTNTPRGVLCRTCNVVEGLIQKTGLHPSEFAARLERYLANPPAQQITDLL